MSLKPPLAGTPGAPSLLDDLVADVAELQAEWPGTEAALDARLDSVESSQAATQKKTEFAVITNPIGAFSGAVGDGATDNTAVIQAWVDWVESNLDVTRMVYVPASEYGFVTEGVVLKTASLVGEQPSRQLLHGEPDFASRLVHKSGSTQPLITMTGMALGNPDSSRGWECVMNLALRGRQKQNISVPKRPIVSAASRTQFTVATGHVPAAPSNVSAFPFYGLCLFFDAEGHRLGSGVVQNVNPGTGQITLATGTDNYTGITGSSNLLTNTETVAFAPIATWDGDDFTHTDESDSTMIGPPAILMEGRLKRVEWVDMRDFHCSIVLQSTISHINHIWSHNHVMAGVALRNIASGADIWGDQWFFQGRNWKGSAQGGAQEAEPTIGRIDGHANHSLCGMWGLPGVTQLGSVVCEAHIHAIIERGSHGTHFDYLNCDGCWKEPIVTWGGLWLGGTASPVNAVDFLHVRTLQPQYTELTSPNYPSGARNIFAIVGTDAHRKWDVGTLVCNRFSDSSPAGFDYAALASLAVPTNGFHEVAVRSIPFQAALTTKAVPRGQSALPGAYATTRMAPLFATAQAVAANVGRITRFEVERDMVVSSIAFSVSTAASNDDEVDVGIYDAGGARLVSSGATTGRLNSTGRKTVAIAPTLLRAGRFYYLAISTGAVGGTPATLIAVSPGSLGSSQFFGTTIGLVETDAASSRHPLPSTWAIGAISSVGCFGAVLE
jgi:hypothetical protein